MKVWGKYTSLPFGGIPTFLKAPFSDSIDEIPGGAVGVIGVPFDEMTTNRPGARFGPRAIREASTVYSYWEGGKALDRGRGRSGLFDIESERVIIGETAVIDFSDVPVSPGDGRETMRRITATIGALLDRGLFPLVLGGDHSITYPVIEGFGGSCDELWVLQLDSHLDCSPEIDGSEYTHASPMRHAGGLGFVKCIVHAGARGLLGDEDVLEETRGRGNVVVTTGRILRDGIEALLSRLPDVPRCYVSIDIDVFDPSVAPGTGVPEPGGLSFREVRAILESVAAAYDVVGFDVVEVNPLYDPAGVTAQLAARTAIDFLGAIHAGRER